MMNLKKLYLKLGHKLFGKVFLEGETKVYESTWAFEVGNTFHKVDLDWAGGSRIITGKIDDMEVEYYRKGETIHKFASHEHALEGGRRMIEALKKYHEELGY